MPSYDPDKLAKRVSSLRASLSRLKALSKLDKRDFLSDPDKPASAKYHFIVAIESCIDISSHLISRNGLRAPEDYADTFRVLAESGVIEDGFAARLVNMAKFRNRLVHIYWEVGDDQLWQILTTRLGDFKKLLVALSAYLELDDGQL